MGFDRVYAIGDIHGQLEKLRAAHEMITRDQGAHAGESVIVHIGDLVDRGPDSAGVLDYLIKGLASGKPWVVLRGNHDRMMAYYLQDPPKTDPGLRPDYTWLTPRVGGQTTLASYGLVEPAHNETGYHTLACQAVPAEHVAFLLGLDTVFRTENALFVHAGIRPGVPFDQQSETDLIWIREPFLSDTRDHGTLVVHGHTPIDAVTHYGNRVNIDTGAGYGGPLSTVVVEGRDIWHLADGGRSRLMPS